MHVWELNFLFYCSFIIIYIGNEIPNVWHVESEKDKLPLCSPCTTKHLSLSIRCCRTQDFCIIPKHFFSAP